MGTVAGRWRLWRAGSAAFCLMLGVWLGWPEAGLAQSADDLRAMSIDELINVDVSSVTKVREALSEAPAAIYVISHADIVRSGANSVPEMLRLAPNLQVYQTSASHYVITARGFSGNPDAQSFANKLLVLIDGRSVYTPLFSGVYWDMQDVLPDDVDRIEVISGPGATLWGANAINGVINIITRNSGQTQGLVAKVGAGNRERAASLRYGGRINDALTYRLYAKASSSDQTRTAAGAGGHDAWSKPQGGFRFDWTPDAADSLTVQGDAYKGSENQNGAADEHIVGRNVTGRWNRSWAGGAASQVQLYYDRMGRTTLDGGGSFHVDTYDVDVQHSFALGSRNQVTAGGGYRIARYRIHGTVSLAFAPEARALHLANAFLQDSITVTGNSRLILGVKIEDDPFSGATLLPSARATWRPGKAVMLWAAASRAIRSPTPFDNDVVEKIGSTVFLTGSPNFRSEKLDAYEAGLRVQPASALSLSVSGFYNVYDDLRSIEITPVTFLPLQWGNGLRGRTYGVEAWADYRVAPWWRLSAGLNLLRERLRFKAGASGILGVAQAGNDPRHQASLRSSMNVAPNITLDANLRYVGALPDPHVPSYVEMGSRIAWNVSDRLQLAASGFNLLHDHHQELAAPQADAVPRSFYLEVQWRI